MAQLERIHIRRSGMAAFLLMWAVLGLSLLGAHAPLNAARLARHSFNSAMDEPRPTADAGLPTLPIVESVAFQAPRPAPRRVEADSHRLPASQALRPNSLRSPPLF